MKQGAKNEMLVPLAVVIANASGVAVALVAPAFLPPAEYSTFALAWAVGQFLAMLCFEWLRFPALRFSVGPDAELAAERGVVIAASYRWMAIAILILVAATAVLARGSGAIAITPFALIYAVCQGTFDGRQAFARAARDNGAYARAWATRALLSIALVIAISWATRSGGAAVVALGLSFPMVLLPSLLMARRRAGGGAGVAKRWSEMPRLARYGVLGAVSGVVAYAVPPLVRWALVAQLGKEHAAGALLAADLTQKALSVTGLAVNVVAMQNSFSAIDTGNADVILKSNQRQIAWAFAAVVPIGLFVWLLGSDIAQVLMRQAYRPAFSAAVGPCALAAGLICVRLFAVDPLFYGFEKAGFSVLGAAVSLVTCLLGVGIPTLLGMHGIDPLMIFWVSGAVGLTVSGTVAMSVVHIRPPWSQLARIAVAAALVMLVGWTMPAIGGFAGLIARGAALGLTYVAAALALDIVWLRTEMLPRLIGRHVPA